MMLFHQGCWIARQEGYAPGTVLFSAWELTSKPSTYSMLRVFDGSGVLWGRIGSSRLPKEIQKLPPGSPQRARQIEQYRRAEYFRAYGLILSAFPETEDGMCSGGFVSLAGIPADSARAAAHANATRSSPTHPDGGQRCADPTPGTAGEGNAPKA